MLSDALPLTSVTTPSVVAPSRNVTAPVGTPAPDVTVELSVTVWPTIEGFGVEVRLVDVAAAAGALTTWFTVDRERVVYGTRADQGRGSGLAKARRVGRP